MDTHIIRSVWLASVLALMRQPAVAQLAGAASVMPDSSYQALLAALKVHTIHESVRHGDSVAFSASMVYDKPGRLKQYTWRAKTVLLFDKDDRYTGEINYEYDTSKVSRFSSYGYDQHRHIIQEKYWSAANADQDTTVVSWKVIRSAKDECTRKRNYTGEEKKPVGYRIETDSTSGIYRCTVSIDHMAGPFSTDEQKACSYKELSRVYRINGYEYEDMINSKLCGGTEVFTRCMTRYKRFDEHNRRVEEGRLDYSEVLKRFGVRLSESDPPKALPGAFISSVLSGAYRDTQPVAHSRQEWIAYDARGHVIDWESRNVHVRSVYNTKGQLTEVTTTGDYGMRMLFTYNEAGLLIKSRLDPGAGETVYEYAYTFFR